MWQLILYSIYFEKTDVSVFPTEGDSCYLVLETFLIKKSLSLLSWKLSVRLTSHLQIWSTRPRLVRVASGIDYLPLVCYVELFPLITYTEPGGFKPFLPGKWFVHSFTWKKHDWCVICDLFSKYNLFFSRLFGVRYYLAAYWFRFWDLEQFASW